MKIKVLWVGKTKEPAIESLTAEYVKRISRYAPLEANALRDESAVLQNVGAVPSQKKFSTQKSILVLMDSRGKQFSSEEFARFLGGHFERNPVPLAFAIGPADGFSDEARVAAQHLISLGRMTLPHELARIVLLEQLYRALTILKGHPYHCGH